MSNLSQNIGLILPEKKEKYTVEIVNENNKKIDEELHNLDIKILSLGSMSYYRGRVNSGNISGDLTKYEVSSSMTLNELFLALPDNSTWDIYFNSQNNMLNSDMPVTTGGIMHVVKDVSRATMYFFDYRTGNIYTTPVIENVEFKWSLIGSNEEILSHINDDVIHITKKEREQWDNASLGLQINNEAVYLDKKDGKYGINTDPERGADTFIPFKSEEGNGGENNSNFDYPFVIRLTSGSSGSSDTNFTTKASNRFKAITYINIKQPKKIVLKSGSFMGVRADVSGYYQINIYAKNNEESESIIKSYSCSGGSSLKDYKTDYNENEEINISEDTIYITKFEVVRSSVSSDDTKIFNPFYDMIFEIYY